jgi:hypothetical protein
MAQKTVRVLANTGNKNLPTRNIVTSGHNTFPTYKQTSLPTHGNNQTVQDSGGKVKGLETVIIPGYVGPA